MAAVTANESPPLMAGGSDLSHTNTFQVKIYI